MNDAKNKTTTVDTTRPLTAVSGNMLLTLGRDTYGQVITIYMSAHDVTGAPFWEEQMKVYNYDLIHGVPDKSSVGAFRALKQFAFSGVECE